MRIRPGIPVPQEMLRRRRDIVIVQPFYRSDAHLRNQLWIIRKRTQPDDRIIRVIVYVHYRSKITVYPE